MIPDLASCWHAQSAHADLQASWILVFVCSRRRSVKADGDGVLNSEGRVGRMRTARNHSRYSSRLRRLQDLDCLARI